MDKDEFLTESGKLDERLARDVNSYDMLMRANFLWIKTRQPELHEELMRKFQIIESSVYAHRQEQDAKDLF